MKQTKTVRGIHAPTPKLTLTGAALLALCVAVPAGLVIGLVDWLLL